VSASERTSVWLPCWLGSARFARSAASARPLVAARCRRAGATPASVKPLSLPAFNARGSRGLPQRRFLCRSHHRQQFGNYSPDVSAVRKSNTTTRSLVTLLQSSKQVAVNMRYLQFNQRANPSIERTCKGWPRYAGSSLSASRGQPLPAAHVER